MNPLPKPARRGALGIVRACCMVFAALACPAMAQKPFAEAPQALTATPPSFNVQRLQTFEASPGSALVYGIDPATLVVDNQGVVRYVLVARSASGALNVLYEGIRCQTAELITYARWDNRSAWNIDEAAEWRPLSSSGSTRHAMSLARAAVCDGPTPNGDASNILRTLKRGSAPER